jgi:hypothetical protein
LPTDRNGEVRVGRELVSDRQPAGLDNVEREMMDERRAVLIVLKVLLVGCLHFLPRSALVSPLPLPLKRGLRGRGAGRRTIR